MSFLHNHSCECIKSELDLFALPSTQTSIENGAWIHYKPISSLADDGPIEFQVPEAGDDYMDLFHTLIHIKAKVTNQDCTKLNSSAVVAPVNNWLHSLFSQLDIYNILKYLLFYLASIFVQKFLIYRFRTRDYSIIPRHRLLLNTPLIEPY